MTQEDKELLLKDLCARIPYNVTCQFTWTYYNETTNGEEVIAKENDNIRKIDIDTKEIQAAYYDEWVNLENCKPYLRSLSSITEDEERELEETLQYTQYTLESYDWLLAHHFDFRELIQKDLALEAKPEMYKI